MPQQMQANATTNPKKCHNKCKEMPQQMQRDATTNAKKCHNKCTEMPQQMQRDATTNAKKEVNVATYVYLFFGGPDPSRVVLSDQVKI